MAKTHSIRLITRLLLYFFVTVTALGDKTSKFIPGPSKADGKSLASSHGAVNHHGSKHGQATTNRSPEKPRPLCSPLTCGQGNCLIPGKAAFVVNETFDDKNRNSPLQKRIAEDRLVGGPGQPSLATYLAAQCSFNQTHNSPYYGKTINVPGKKEQGGFFDSPTASIQLRLGRHPFQIGLWGMRGCSFVTIVSPMAVFMMHLWEFPWMWHAAGSPEFDKAVLNYFTNREPRDTVAPPLNADLFNGRQTKAYIMYPSDYHMQVHAIAQTLQHVLPDAEIRDHAYVPVRYLPEHGRTAEEVAGQTTEQGVVLFQYDPYSRDRKWRLFYEGTQYSE